MQENIFDDFIALHYISVLHIVTPTSKNIYEACMTNKQFDNEGYNLTITGKNIQVTEAIDQYVREKISKVEHFTDHILDIVVTLEVQKLSHTVTIIMKFLHYKIKVQAVTEDLYSAIDKATEKLLKLIQKYKTKLQEHRVKDLSVFDMNVNVLGLEGDVEEINEQIDEENLKDEEEIYKFHKVVSTDKMPIKMLTQDEAVMKMELSGDNFMIYRSEEDQSMNVIYRRRDQEFGVIEIQS
ncbi:MAG TPA: ribosome-associated translation inhibitor RaiA [Chlamydiales bacterium]|nr:ribosome-associated translation inhibitor RaiA [Chlamydiales bacterium]